MKPFHCFRSLRGLMGLWLLVSVHELYANDCVTSPEFETYAIGSEFEKRRFHPDALPRMDTPFSRQYRSAILAALENGEATLAGKWSVFTVGCGTNCLVVGMVNLLTSKVVELPPVYRVENPSDFPAVETRFDSSLVIYRGTPEGYMGRQSQHYYLLSGERLILLCRGMQRN